MTRVSKLRDGLFLIDLNFQGEPGVIAAYLIEDAGKYALVEVGPTSTVDALLEGVQAAGVSPDAVSKVLVTHIHLDHAGAAGTLVRRFPHLRVYVHDDRRAASIGSIETAGKCTADLRGSDGPALGRGAPGSDGEYSRRGGWGRHPDRRTGPDQRSTRPGMPRTMLRISTPRREKYSRAMWRRFGYRASTTSDPPHPLRMSI